ncbi:MAG TPA: tRNA lysidine(34) synthetase TilS [Fibrobacteria bacterium]|nr:tRNA lysidine(34) synthetase TilS [Fibrobacteria bacterium]
MTTSATTEDSDPARAIAAWEARTFAFLESMGFAPHGADLVLAVSGGADSMALLEFWAVSGAARFGCRLHVAHVHHGLRAAADLDEALVAARCRALGIPYRIFRLDPTARGKGESIEMWARRERYRCFSEAAASAAEAAASAAEAAVSAAAAPAPVYVLTAHQRDDLVETVFQRLGRGTGVRGLAGIPFRREPGLVRPFLDRTRAELEAYLRLRGAAWREDETNRDLRFGRNRYRHEVLPALRAAEPGLDERVFRMALAIQAMGDGLASLEEDAGLLRRGSDGTPFLAGDAVEDLLARGASASLRYWLGRLAADEEGKAEGTGTEEILGELKRQWLRGRDATGTQRIRVALAPGVWLERRKNGYYRVQAESNTVCPFPPRKVILVEDVGGCEWSWYGRTWRFTARRYPRPPDLRFPASGENRAIFDADLISCTLLLRTRKAGDRFSPHGVRSGTRKLKVFMNERKIPVRDRGSLPLVFAGLSGREADEGTLAWVPGYATSEFFKVGDRTLRVLEMELECLNP